MKPSLEKRIIYEIALGLMIGLALSMAITYSWFPTAGMITMLFIGFALFMIGFYCLIRWG